MSAHRLTIGTLSVDVVTFPEAVRAIEKLIDDRRGGTVFTPNVDHVVQAESDARLRDAYSRASLSLADGMPLVWSSPLFGARLPEKVSGSDLVLPLMDLAARRGFKVYLLGGAPGVGVRAAERLVERFPALEIVGVDAPRIEIGSKGDPRIVERIKAARADLVLAALGAPKQEIWSDSVKSELAPAVLLGVGASLDFIAGGAARAPGWVSAAGLEWVHRLGQDPKRLWRRYLLQDPKFLFILLRALVAQKGGRRGSRRPR